MKKSVTILLFIVLLTFSSCGNVFFENYKYDTDYASIIDIPINT